MNVVLDQIRATRAVGDIEGDVDTDPTLNFDELHYWHTRTFDQVQIMLGRYTSPYQDVLQNIQLSFTWGVPSREADQINIPAKRNEPCKPTIQRREGFPAVIFLPIRKVHSCFETSINFHGPVWTSTCNGSNNLLNNSPSDPTFERRGLHDLIESLDFSMQPVNPNQPLMFRSITSSKTNDLLFGGIHR